MRPIGVFGGMFDPIHLGHLRAALEVGEALGLAEVRFVPCGDPPHRAGAHAPAALRERLVAAAIAGEPRFRLDRRELARPGPHFTVETLESLRSELGAEVPLVLLLGADAFAGLDLWRRWEQLFELAHLAVMLRPDSALPGAPPLAAVLERRRVWRAEELAARPHGGIWVQEVTPLAISSTQLRERIARGASVRYLVPDAVQEQLQVTGAYRSTRRGSTQ